MAISGLSQLDASNQTATAVLDQRLALDVQGVDALRRTVRSSPQEGMKQASKQFEVLFMQMVLKSMREASPAEGMFGSQQEKMYTSMLDQQMAQHLSGRGLGLAEAMYAQLSRSIKGDSAAAPAAAASGKPLSGANGPAPMNPAPAAQTRPVPDRSVLRAQDLSLYEEATAQATLSRSVLPQAHVEQFVSRMLPAAQRASQESGVPAQLIMAQAALESGWGRNEIRADDGRPSYNLFGIKADRSWKGPVVEATTTEYVNGIAQKTRASFRAYGSYEEAFFDHGKFLTTNPRYANVLSARDPADAALGLQQAGYASDPKYGGKLIRIMKQMT
ncbi:MAG: flagellar assembly peptidoglycan hydrolase FlgJ [Rhodoferax sp.]